MADYFGTLYLSRLPFCREKLEMINGVEKPCLVIPCDESQMVRTKYGGWCLKLKINEVDPNPQMRTNNIRLGYRNEYEVEKAKKLGYYKTSDAIGHLFLSEYGNEDRRNDYTNNMTPILCNGLLFLDSIQDEDIKTDQNTGRKYVNFSFRKSKVLDSFGNSHEVVVGGIDSEHQIGVAKEIPIEKGGITTTVSPVEDNIVSSQRPNNQKDKNIPDKYDSWEW